jgi:hypothetical protein
MQRVFVSIMAGSVQDEELTVIRSLIDFIYYAQFQQHTSKTLAALQCSLKVFHAHKKVLIKLGIWEHFRAQLATKIIFFTFVLHQET